jgi:predicted PurR-regulated permease PerM
VLGIDARTARITWTIAVVIGTIGFVYLIRQTLFVFVCAILLAYLLAPIVDIVERFARGRFSRTFSLGAVYLLLLVVAGSLLSAIAARVGAEATGLMQKLPEYLANPQLPVPALLEPYRETLVEWVRGEFASSKDHIMPLLQSASESALALASNVIFFLIIPILSFFILKDSGELRETMVNQFGDGPNRQHIEGLLADIHALLIVYMRALVVLSLATFVAYWAFFALLGVPYSATLALFAALLEFVPGIGPLAAALGILLISAFAGFPHIVALIVFFVVYRIVQDYGLQPLLFSSGVELPPLAIMFGVFAGEQAAGAVGMFLSIPTLAILRIIYLRYRKVNLT